MLGRGGGGGGGCYLFIHDGESGTSKRRRVL